MRGLGLSPGGEAQVCLQGLHGGLAGVLVSVWNLFESCIALHLISRGGGRPNMDRTPPYLMLYTPLSNAGDRNALRAKYIRNR